MISNYLNFLFEKSSLTPMGVTKPVMQHIQRDYALNPDSEWVKIDLKRDIKKILIKNTNNLIIQIGSDYIKVLVSVYDNNTKLYYIDRYIKKTGEWGDEWVKAKREGMTLTAMLHEVEMENKYYLLKSGDFSVVRSDIRKIEKEDKEFDTFNKKFREELINYFTILLNNSYSSVAAKIEKTIVDNLAKVSDGLSPDDVRRVLYQNVEQAKKSKAFKAKAADIPKYKLSDDTIQHNSLTLFDEYLLQFEDDYSKKYHKYYTIKTLVDEFSRPKIITAFVYYLYTGNLMDLNSFKTVSVLDDLNDFEDSLENDF